MQNVREMECLQAGLTLMGIKLNWNTPCHGFGSCHSYAPLRQRADNKMSVGKKDRSAFDKLILLNWSCLTLQEEFPCTAASAADALLVTHACNIYLALARKSDSWTIELLHQLYHPAAARIAACNISLVAHQVKFLRVLADLALLTRGNWMLPLLERKEVPSIPFPSLHTPVFSSICSVLCTIFQKACWLSELVERSKVPDATDTRLR